MLFWNTEKNFCAGFECKKGKCEHIQSGDTFVPKCRCEDGWKGDHCETETVVKTADPTKPTSGDTDAPTTAATKEEKTKATNSDNKEELFKWIIIGIGAVLILVIIANVACLIV